MQLFRIVHRFLKRFALCFVLTGLAFLILVLVHVKIIHDTSCPKSAIITVTPGGELGNAIWEYMSVYALICLHPGVSVGFVPPEIKENIDTLFESLSLPTTYELSSICRMNRYSYEVELKESFNSTTLTEDYYITLRQYSARYNDIVECGIDRMKEEMQFKPEYIIEAKHTLADAAEKFHIKVAHATFVGVHFRGNNYNGFLENIYQHYLIEIPVDSYYQKAMDFFTKKFQNVIFIVISVDGSWVSSTLPLLSKNRNVIVNPNGNDRNKDLVLLSHCNHSIISYGTYGVTAALFANGTTFVYDLGIPIDHRGPTLAMGLTKILSHWHLLGNIFCQVSYSIIYGLIIFAFIFLPIWHKKQKCI